jgi:hypothetical protein
MHLHFSPQDEAFRREVAAWLDTGGEFKALRAGARQREPLVERLPGSAPGRRARGRLAPEWGPRRLAHPAGDLPRGIRARARSRPPRPHRRGPARTDAAGLRKRRTEASLPARHRVRRGDLVPGLLGAERRLRPRQRADPRAPRGRRVGDRRAEGLDLVGAVGGLVLRRLPQRPGLRAARGALVPARADAPAGASRSGRSCR